MRNVFVTGSAGFIGFHLCLRLLEEGFNVTGFDGLTNYYDVTLKERRNAILEEYPNFQFYKGQLENIDALGAAMTAAKPNIIVHLAAQAGVRHSLEVPRDYVNTNYVGTFNLLECAMLAKPDHLLLASTSSVYGGNTTQPFDELQTTATPLNIYSASKIATEAMAHAYAHLNNVPTTMFRFFTVFGPWGRPDMALFKFVNKTLNGQEIDIYNNGKMQRDFTYISDLVEGIRLLIDTPPLTPEQNRTSLPDNDSISNVAPFRVINIGNAQKIKLLDFVDAIESALGLPTVRNYLPMQPGEVLETFADNSLLRSLTGFTPKAKFQEGIQAFVDWYLQYYKIPHPKQK